MKTLKNFFGYFFAILFGIIGIFGVYLAIRRTAYSPAAYLSGATPNAMANMQAVCDQYVPSIKAYLLIPLVGSLFADFLNSLVITFFINLM